MSATTDPNPRPYGNSAQEVCAELAQYVPFCLMKDIDLARLVHASVQTRHGPGELLVSPASGVPSHLIFIRSGHVVGRGDDGRDSSGFEFEPGDLLPVSAVMAARPVTSRYSAHDGVECLRFPVAELHAVAALSRPLSEFLQGRMQKQLELARQAMQATVASQILAEQSLETALGELALKAPVSVLPQTPLHDALSLMHTSKIGSMLVVDEAAAAVGILTRHDILDRVALARVPLEAPIGQVMTQPIHTLDVQNTAQDAALLMSRHSIRHVPVTRDGKTVGMVSERDLFSMQRMSIRHVSSGIRSAQDEAALIDAAQQLRKFARHLIGQGVAARQTTQLISHLNDLLTEQLVQMKAATHGLDMGSVCWLAFGSEGRSEQTISTDQDNGLIFVSEHPEQDRPRWLAFARDVNEALDRCGYPLCKGNVMASNPQCCLTLKEWSIRFADWLEHGAPEDLLKANIYFDLRALVGRTDLADTLRAQVTRQAAGLPRFAKQMADNALRHRVPLNWRGAINTKTVDAHAMVDLKSHGTAVFVDIARLYALALGVPHTGTRERLEAIGPMLHVPPPDNQAWVAAFEYLQMLRLQVQMADTPLESANLVELKALNNIDRHMLKESLRMARQLMQKIELDYP